MIDNEITPVRDDEKYTYPKYSDKGIVVVEILSPGETGVYRWEIDRSGCDTDQSPFYIMEGMGVDYWVDLYGNEIPGPGIWTFEGVCGTYHRGEWGYSDDDEDWYYDNLRPATEKEIAEYL